MSVVLQKSAREELRVSLEVFRGQMLLNLRVWFCDDEGEMRPGRQGVALRAELLPELQTALDRLEKGEA